MINLLNKHLLSPIKERLNAFIGFTYYVFGSAKRKHACKIIGISISKEGRKVNIQFSVLFKPTPFNNSPIELIDNTFLLSKFSQEESAMIGLLSALYFQDDDRKKQLDKIFSIYPKLKDLINDDKG